MKKKQARRIFINIINGTYTIWSFNNDYQSLGNSLLSMSEANEPNCFKAHNPQRLSFLMLVAGNLHHHVNRTLLLHVKHKFSDHSLFEKHMTKAICRATLYTNTGYLIRYQSAVDRIMHSPSHFTDSTFMERIYTFLSETGILAMISDEALESAPDGFKAMHQNNPSKRKRDNGQPFHMSKQLKLTLSSRAIRRFFREKKTAFNKHFIDNRNRLDEAYRTDNYFQAHSIIKVLIIHYYSIMTHSEETDDKLLAKDCLNKLIENRDYHDMCLYGPPLQHQADIEIEDSDTTRPLLTTAIRDGIFSLVEILVSGKKITIDRISTDGFHTILSSLLEINTWTPNHQQICQLLSEKGTLGENFHTSVAEIRRTFKMSVNTITLGASHEAKNQYDCIVKLLLSTALKEPEKVRESLFNINSNFSPNFVTSHAIISILILRQQVDTFEQSSSSFSSEDQSDRGCNHRELTDDEKHIFRCHMNMFLIGMETINHFIETLNQQLQVAAYFNKINVKYSHFRCLLKIIKLIDTDVTSNSAAVTNQFQLNDAKDIRSFSIQFDEMSSQGWYLYFNVLCCVKRFVVLLSRFDRSPSLCNFLNDSSDPTVQAFLTRLNEDKYPSVAEHSHLWAKKISCITRSIIDLQTSGSPDVVFFQPPSPPCEEVLIDNDSEKMPVIDLT